MQDPYDLLGVNRGASVDDVKAAYRKACKAKHPDLGGSHEDMVALNAAYAFVLEDLKRGYDQQREEELRQRQSESADQRAGSREQHAGRSQEEAEREWQRAYSDIDDELEELRRASEAYDEALQAMRTKAWEAGDRATWAKLTWSDLTRFFRTIFRSGLKGIALLFAALVGIGSILVQANVISAIVILGSGVGFFLSIALKNDKGGMMSAGLLLFGIMTIWLPPVRAALFYYPLATVSVLICLGLILKFAQQGGAAGLMTGGVLALYVIFVVAEDTQQRPQTAKPQPTLDISKTQTHSAAPVPAPAAPQLPTQPSQQTATRGNQNSASSNVLVPPATAALPVAQPPVLPPAVEPRTLLAANGAVLKFVVGVPYQLKVRTGFTTSLQASQGTVAFYSGDQQVGPCTDKLEFLMRAGAVTYQEVDRTIRACGSDAVVRVVDVR